MYHFHIQRNNLSEKQQLISVTILPLVIVLHIITLSIVHCKTRWFVIDSAQGNPYKLVYRVTKFSYKHEVPIQRSAFTYCEDEVPSGLDLGKAKYGGPFTTEQVEDVKAFYGILKVLFSMGPAFFMGIATDQLLDNYYFHTQNNYNRGRLSQTTELYLLGDGLLHELIIVVFIPLYIYIVRPFVFHYIPGISSILDLVLL